MVSIKYIAILIIDWIYETCYFVMMFILLCMVSMWWTWFIDMVWLRIKDDSSSDNSYPEIIWMMEDIVDKHSVTFRYIII